MKQSKIKIKSAMKTKLLSLFTLLVMQITVSAQLTWNVVGTPPTTLSPTQAIAVDSGNKIYASYIGDDAKAYVLRWNFVSWENIGYVNYVPKSIGVYSITKIITDNANNVYCLGARDNLDRYFVGKWNGTSWSVLGDLFSSNQLIDIATDGTNIFVAGDFISTVNGQTYYINKWNGTEWSAHDIGSLNGAVRAMHVDKDGNLNVGGEFRITNGKYGVKKKVGSSWAEVGSLQSDAPIVRLLCDKLGNVYVTSGGKLSRYEPSNGNYRQLADINQAGFVDIKLVDNDNMVYAMATCGTPCQNLFVTYSNYANEGTQHTVSYGVGKGAVSTFAKDNFGYLLIGSYEKTWNAGNYGVIKSSGVFMATEELDKTKISVYPNPVKDILNFSEEVTNIRIIDFSGRTVKQIYTSEKSINLENLAKGIYNITATTKTGKAINQKIIKP